MQLHEGRAPHLVPIQNGGFVKPKGGLWTSTYDERLGSDWIQWCLSEEFRGPEFDCWLLRPREGAKVYTIDSLADLIDLVYAYGALRNSHADYEKIARDYDGVRLTKEGQWATRFSYPYSLYGWDCESTLWFRWCFESVEHLGVRVFTEKDEDE